ncbi:hypothetical protein FRX31_029453 [Thalictrum thalictroides]|uniref:Uncharacterized protein n=1 Tax=Thalictrum thalictroides TaxID=46969 RepID=A0A7J6V872_THATH|nr:hypothetical protein FRX31_029453 [Thalictrum thalictroides]
MNLGLVAPLPDICDIHKWKYSCVGVVALLQLRELLGHQHWRAFFRLFYLKAQSGQGERQHRLLEFVRDVRQQPCRCEVKCPHSFIDTLM